MPEYCIYLRKSRADIESEAKGELETLVRHEKALTDLARRQGLNITRIYREIVSGETIHARPVVQQLLDEVEQGCWAGVLVMEVERLARGDTIDQGIVAQAFKFSNTKIITPVKTYDPNNEFDEEYFEFGLFMSRREYKTINRRLQRGRLASVKEGNYIASCPPYGYDKIKLTGEKSGFSLKPNPQADTVRQIFEWFSQGLGTSKIAAALNLRGIKPLRGDIWTATTIRDMLSNPVYIGKIRWNWRPVRTCINNGEKSKSRPRAKDGITLADGLHEAIIEAELWEKVQDIKKQADQNRLPVKKELKNAFSGLLFCSECGKAMIRRPTADPNKTYFICSKVGCKTSAIIFEKVETSVIDALCSLLAQYKFTIKPKKQSEQLRFQRSCEEQAKLLQAEILKINRQKEQLYDLLEQQIYTKDIFLERSHKLSEKYEQLNKELCSLNPKNSVEKSIRHKIVKFKYVLKRYPQADAAEKNRLLKSVLTKIIYKRDPATRWNCTELELTIFPKI